IKQRMDRDYLNFLIIAAIIAGPMSIAEAQANDTIPLQGHLEGIEVTAHKEVEELQEVPASISTISEQDAVNERIWDVQKLSDLVPNLYRSHPGDGRHEVGLRGTAAAS